MDDVIACVQEVLAADVSSCDADGLGRILRRVRRLEGWLATVTASATERAVELHANGRGNTPELALQRGAGLSKHAARAAVSRAAALRATPALADALAAGEVGAAHVDAYVRAVERAPVLARQAAALAAAARRTTPEEFARHCQTVAVIEEPEEDAVARFERQCRATRVRRWLDDRTGLYRIDGAFDPETGERIWNAIDAAVERLFHDRRPPSAPDDARVRPAHLAALALADLVGGARASGSGRADTIMCTIDHDTLLRGLHERTGIELAHGGCLPVAVVRKLACDANIIPVVLGGDGVVLDVGRKERLATPDQRRALRVMYPTCAVPGCATRFTECAIHHLEFWGRDDGTTDLGTQAPLCGRHHADVHLGRITIELVARTREITVRARDGSVLAHAPGPPARQAA